MPAMNVIIIAHCKVSVKLDLCQGLVERYGNSADDRVELQRQVRFV